ncbi:MAG: hypothetical protein GKR88_04640 [Flavobacteriaceae bacterium]|nr:MAG: hypothetical protein GKR88_04640 [Flavobacteriaceae bacterium]
MSRYLIFIFLLTSFSLQSQALKGTIKDSDGIPIRLSTLSLFQSDVQKKFFTIRDGKFNIQLKDEYIDSVKLVIKSNGYIDNSIEISELLKGKVYKLNFEMKKSEFIILEEIIIKSKKKKFKVKKDTLIYNINEYKDGTERKLQDVLNKLPGVEVNESSGQIKYKGKPVETVLLEGDNLFGYNYSLGTKNININMVEQIEAIENYSENPLLKGIERGDKVALNLKLKKGNIDLSGNVDLASGLFNDGKPVFNTNSNILGIQKGYKSFATLSYNNIGINHSPFNYFDFNFNAEQIREQKFFSKKHIPESRIPSSFDTERVNINNQFFTNYNAIFNIGKRLNLRTNLYLINDRIRNNQFLSNDYVINDVLFSTFDDNFLEKKPIQYRGDIKLTFNVSRNSLLEYDLKIRNELIETNNTTFSNNNNFESNLKSEDFFFKQNLLLTKKLSSKKALQVSATYSTNNIPQYFKITSSVFNSNQTSTDFQESNQRKDYFEFNSILLGNKDDNKYSFSIGYINDTNPLNTRFYNRRQGNEILINSLNLINFQKNIIYNRGSYDFKLKEFVISPSYSFRVLFQKLNDENSINHTTNFIFEPAINLTYKLNRSSLLRGRFGYNVQSEAENYLFTNEILSNNRLTVSNQPSLNLQKSQSYNLSYYNNDIYNQLQLNGTLSYRRNDGNFFSDSEINNTVTQIQYFFLDEDSEDFSISLDFSKFMDFIDSTVKISSNYSISKYRNIVNDSDLRDNLNNTLQNSFTIKTSFESSINFENNLTWSLSESKSEGSETFSNGSLNNLFNIYFRPSKNWFLSITSNYYLPNTSQPSNNYIFLDSHLRYKMKNKIFEMSLVAKNILNEDNFEDIEITDFSTNIYRSNILPSHFLLNLTWNF